MKKVLNKCLSLIPYFFLLVAFILILSFANAVRKGEVPTIFNRAVFIVLTPSMEDTLMEGDMILVDTEPDMYTVGDIITFRRPDQTNMIITHRIVDIQSINGESLYTTKGDNNQISGDYEINFSEDYIIGKYVSKSALVGGIYNLIFAGGINLIFFIIVLVFVIIGAMEVSNIIKQVSIAKKKELLEEKERLIQEELEKLRQQQKTEE